MVRAVLEPWVDTVSPCLAGACHYPVPTRCSNANATSLTLFSKVTYSGFSSATCKSQPTALTTTLTIVQAYNDTIRHMILQCHDPVVSSSFSQGLVTEESTAHALLRQMAKRCWLPSVPCMEGSCSHNCLNRKKPCPPPCCDTSPADHLAPTHFQVSFRRKG